MGWCEVCDVRVDGECPFCATEGAEERYRRLYRRMDRAVERLPYNGEEWEEKGIRIIDRFFAWCERNGL